MHAYLIIAHNHLNQLIKLLKLLDYEQNDIYVHIDRKSNKDMQMYDYSACCKKSKVYIFSEFKINWGSSNQIRCELFLLEAAVKNDKYEYYHLLSGSDLPLKSQEEIHEFFSKNKGKEFINFSSLKNQEELINRVKYYRISDYYDILPYKSFKIMRRLDKYQIIFQKLIGVNRMKKDEQLYKGANWFSITDDLARSLVNEKANFLEKYRYSLCCDEVFLQTYIHNNDKFLKRVYRLNYSDDCSSIVRKIDWNRGGPYIWHTNDYEELMDSNCMFARKFDESVDETIIEMIYNNILYRSTKNEE